MDITSTVLPETLIRLDIESMIGDDQSLRTGHQLLDGRNLR
jgi:hypothetical protein